MASASYNQPQLAGHNNSKSAATTNANPYTLMFNQRKQRSIYRPHSTKLFAGPGHFTLTSYKDDYIDPHTKPHYKPMGPMNVRNNPHPTEAFMVYHLCQKETPLHVSYSNTENLEKLIAQQQIATTYQDDYRGKPAKVQSGGIHVSKRKDLPGLIDSTMHHDYKAPVQNINLQGNTTRYGCNVGIVKAAYGAVPTLDKQTLPPMSKNKTWYSSDFGSLRHSDLHKRTPPKELAIHLPAISKEVHWR